jgi:Tfp pilus assembly protein PilV
MMPRSPHSSRPTASRQAGFTLMNVLVAALIFGLGVLGMLRSVVGVTAAATQNSNVSVVGSLSDGFLAVVQANSALLGNASFAPKTFTQANYTTAPAALQDWLLQTTTALPAAQVKITTDKDSASGAACSRYGGCTVTLEIQWTQVGAGGSANLNRTQTFFYQLGQ